MSRRNVVRLFAAIGMGAGLTFAGPTLPAVGQVFPPPPPPPPTTTLSVELGDEATLVARGAAVSVPVEVICPAGSIRFVNAQVTQRVGSRIARGFGGTELTCTGTTQTVEVLVRAQEQAFKRGSAVGEASMFFCDPFFFCQSVMDTETIRIVR
ncbi:MAG TPA: hypothetical protein VM942_11020 [Acidimicrobiales bacterium]|nr:hypothetical protein [Acidimicrobiales bacterium]